MTKSIYPAEFPDDAEAPSGDSRSNDTSSVGAEIKEFGSITTCSFDGVLHCLTIIGQVEGHYILPPQNKTTKYEHVIPQLVAIEESDEIGGLLVVLNTVGGDVEAGLAIAEMLSSMSKPIVSLVLGGGHSIGVPLAVAAKISFIAPSATMTVHPVRMNGIVIGVPQSFSYVDKMQERIVRFVSSNSRITPEKFRHLMTNTTELASDIGTILSGDEAVEFGLIDRVGGLSEALSALKELAKEYKKDIAEKRGESAAKSKYPPGTDVLHELDEPECDK